MSHGNGRFFLIGVPIHLSHGSALRQWEGLIAYVDNGYAEIDNNTAERSLRPIALGRKKLFICWVGCRWETRSGVIHITLDG